MAGQALDDKAHKKAINSRYDYGGKAHKQSHDLQVLIYVRDLHFAHQYQNKVYSKANVKNDPLLVNLNDLHQQQFHPKSYALLFGLFQY